MNLINLSGNTLSDKKSKQMWWSLIAALLCLVYIIYFVSDFSRNQQEANIKNRIEKTLLEKERKVYEVFNSIIATDQIHRMILESYQQTLKEEKIEIFVYKDDSVVSWSSNLVSIENNIERFRSQKIIKLNNGWYRTYHQHRNGLDVFGAVLLKQTYTYSNEYLKAAFPIDFNVDNSYEISRINSDIDILDQDGNFIFSLNSDKASQLTDNQAYRMFFVVHLLLLLICIFLVKFYENYVNRLRLSPFIYLLVSLDLFIIWAAIKVFEIPNLLFDSFLYSPILFADDFNHSLGGFFTNSFFLLIIFYLIFFKHKFTADFKSLSKSKIYLVLIALSVGLVILLKTYESAVESLLENSQISIQFGQDLIENFWPTFLVFFIISMLSLALFFVFQRAAVIFNKLTKSHQEKLLLVGTFVVIYLISSLTIFAFRPYSLFFVLLIIISYWGIKGDKLKLNTLLVVLYLIIFAAYLSVLSTFVLKEKELHQRSLIIERISQTRDPMAELRFREVQDNVLNDTTLVNLIVERDSISDQMIIEKITEHFDIESWSKYMVFVSLCDEQKNIIFDGEDYEINCQDYFNGIIQDFRQETGFSNLYFIESNTINKIYITYFDLIPESDEDQKIYVELVAELIPDGLGYPELFADEGSDHMIHDLKDYSFAKYQNGDLTYKFGSYFYSIQLSSYDEYATTAQFDLNNFNHLKYVVDDQTSYIISRENKAFWEMVAPFSYYFILISLFILCFAIVTQFKLDFFKAKYSFIHRIQFNFLIIIFSSFLIIAAVTLVYLTNLNDEKNKEILSEKALSVLIELEHKLANEESLQPDMVNFLNGILTKFSLVFFSDINLFDLQGKLIASSRLQVYDEGLISEYMNIDAFSRLSHDQKLLFIQNERIGNYEYLSAYIPFRNSDSKIIAYLNLPYFARQSELQSEITTFMVALVNIYVLFFVLAIVIAVIISRRISKPIQLIRDRISAIQLGKSNEIIEWNRDDEIGDLIAEYNRMIIELSRSANLLAKSEREGAWREMAKQVAHEIKNPLTPMKLSVQYLEKAWDEKSEDWEERLKRFSRTIIDQIDTLSAIASEFSDFAKMPRKRVERVNLVTVIRNSLSLFDDVQNIDFKFDFIEKSCVVDADRAQLLRVFNNLIKNSIQAIGNKQDGEIMIDIFERNGFFKIKVADNGSGISKEMADKIFSPSFTTKTSGMGLGLSIVRSIIIEAGGEISFESEEGKGATFIIQLPVA